MEGPERLAVTALAGGRVAIGTGIMLAPRATLRALGFREPGAQELALARMAGVRDIALGLWQARAEGPELTRATAAVTACDVGDALAFAGVLRNGNHAVGLRGLAAAVPAAVMGAVLAARLARGAA